jgi:hypothetical protein
MAVLIQVSRADVDISGVKMVRNGPVYPFSAYEE